MRHRSAAFLIAACLALPAPARAQGIGLGARVGTVGAGAELAVGLTERVVVRGGVGLIPLERDATFGDIDVTLELPRTWYNAGIDLYLNSAMRIGGGILFKPDDPEVSKTFNQPQDIGGTVFSPAQIGTLKGVIDSKDNAPYVLLGFGRHTAPGFGLFIDLGVAFLGEPDVRLRSEGGTLSGDPTIEDELAREAQDFEDDMRAYLRFWPILNLGVRIGLG